jgi:hypothetical protein
MCARAIQYDLFDVTRLETMLLQELGAKLFGFRLRKPGDEGPGNVTPSAILDAETPAVEVPTKGLDNDQE